MLIATYNPFSELHAVSPLSNTTFIPKLWRPCGTFRARNSTNVSFDATSTLAT